MEQPLGPLEILRAGLTTMHGMLDDATTDMNIEQLNWQSSDGGITPFFSLWHYVRTEDNIMNFVVQGKATVWTEGEFDVQLGLHRTSQGTGMSADEAAQVVLTDLVLWRKYQQSVWAASETYLGTISPSQFNSRKVTIKPLPEMSLWDGLFNICLSHGFRHVGEIEYARGLLGLGGLTI
jgi:hypothetical protein